MDKSEAQICKDVTEEAVKKLREAGLGPNACLVVAAALIGMCSKPGRALETLERVMPELLRTVDQASSS